MWRRNSSRFGSFIVCCDHDDDVRIFENLFIALLRKICLAESTLLTEDQFLQIRDADGEFLDEALGDGDLGVSAYKATPPAELTNAFG